MKMLFRKLFVSLIAVLTLGMYIPPATINTESSDTDTEESKNSESSKLTIHESPTLYTDNFNTYETTIESHSPDHVINALTEKARAQTMEKMGPKIVAHVENEFDQVILPVIENVFASLITASDDIPHAYAITEQPSKGLGERIFHLYDETNEQDIAKFHVRRDLRPLEGYWFNFHYHLYTDNFEEHHEIGNIFWDKNIPPKWMA
ncbi:YpjP family protein [Virgibacillus sp. W0430]|uniref:YpjP family protein n=1 Tax=Virgibacillus sp. W0430 TaxID=3391580 RepID=UPI003F44BE13